MRFFALISVLAAVASVVAGVTLPRQEDNCGSEIGCDPADLAEKREFSGEHAARTVPGMTNAELARRGLPFKDPIMRRHVDHCPRPSASPRPGPKVKHRGIIAVKRRRDDAVLGYISSKTFNKAQYLYRPTRACALIVQFVTQETSPVSQLNLVPLNSDIKGFPFFGLVQGRQDLTSVLDGDFQYTYLANTDQTPAGSPPLFVGNSVNLGSFKGPRTSESAVWTYDQPTERLSPLWVNPDKTIPEVDFFVQNTAIYVGGDAAKFQNQFFRDPVTLVKFEFVPLP